MQRKARVLITGLTLFLLALGYGCVSVEGPATQLRSMPGFQPKKVYAYGYDRLWDKVLQTLRVNRIMIASANKENGIVDTDYIPGWTIDIAALGTETNRYKYQILFQRNAPTQTQLDVICKLESRRMAKGGAAREAVEQLKPWEDVTHRESKRVLALEYWLYEQIEKSL